METLGRTLVSKTAEALARRVREVRRSGNHPGVMAGAGRRWTLAARREELRGLLGGADLLAEPAQRAATRERS